MNALEALQAGQVRLEPLGFHQGFAGQVQQAVQALGRHPQHTLAAFSHAFALARRFTADRRGLQLGLQQQCVNPRRGDGLGIWHGRGNRLRGIEQALHQRYVRLDIRRPHVIARRGDSHQQVGALQQRVDMFRLQVQAAFLGADQAVFHDVGHADPGIHADNPRRPFK